MKNVILLRLPVQVAGEYEKYEEGAHLQSRKHTVRERYNNERMRIESIQFANFKRKMRSDVQSSRTGKKWQV